MLSQDASVTRRNLHEGILNKDQEDEMFVYGYKKSRIRTFICYVCVILTLGILRLVMHWWSHWLLYATHSPCSLEEADKVLVMEKFQGKHSIFYVKAVMILTSDSIRYVRENYSSRHIMNCRFFIDPTFIYSSL